MNDLKTFLFEPSFPVAMVIGLLIMFWWILQGMWKIITNKDDLIASLRLEVHNVRYLKDWSQSEVKDLNAKLAEQEKESSRLSIRLQQALGCRSPKE